ncbi:unnamed protein product, partial [Ectocarpus sp. 8 AP-2014]
NRNCRTLFLQLPRQLCSKRTPVQNIEAASVSYGGNYSLASSLPLPSLGPSLSPPSLPRLAKASRPTEFALASFSRCSTAAGDVSLNHSVPWSSGRVLIP